MLAPPCLAVVGACPCLPLADVLTLRPPLCPASPCAQDVEKRLTRPIPALAADLSLPPEIAARVAGTQAGSGGATQYGQQRGGGVSKEVMERVQVGGRLTFACWELSLIAELLQRCCASSGVVQQAG